MEKQSIMQKALKEQWDHLPQALKNHYQASDNTDVGELSIEYPRGMQIPLNLLRFFGALINRSGVNIPTDVNKTMRREKQYWSRQIRFPSGESVTFKSTWQYDEGNELVEYVNSCLGLRMAVKVENAMLRYEGKCFEVRLGKIRFSIPEWLMLGHTSIQEEAIDDYSFRMDFRLRHPLFGQIYRYSGTFCTQQLENG